MEIIAIPQKGKKNIASIKITSAQLIELINLSSDNIEEQIKLAEKQIQSMRKIIEKCQPIAQQYYNELEKKEVKIRELQGKCKEIINNQEKVRESKPESMNSNEKKDIQNQEIDYKNLDHGIYRNIAMKNREEIKQKLQEKQQKIQSHRGIEKSNTQISTINKTHKEKIEIVDSGILSQMERKTEQMKLLETKTIKDIRKQIAPVLHTDKLEVKRKLGVIDDDYFIFLDKLFKELKSLYKEKDKDAIILLIENNHIKYQNNDFILPSLEFFQENKEKIMQKKVLKTLHQEVHRMEISEIFSFYKQYGNTNLQQKIDILDKTIEKAESFIQLY
jgi:hypothetical protein